MRFSSIAVLIFFFISVNAQTANYKITYRHCVQFDTNYVLKDTIGKEAILIGNNKESFYSFDKNQGLKALQQDNEKTIENMISGKLEGTFTVKSSGLQNDSIGNILYFNKNNNIIKVREKMENEYILTEETAPKINWVITTEIKLVKKYTCQKAIAYFRGRNYTAWFTTEIPILAAPWKFFGLPGLVMEIKDDKNQIKIYVEKIEYPSIEKILKFAESGSKISLERYINFRQEENKKKLKAVQVLLDNQPNMDEIIKAGIPRPVVKSNIVLYSIEIKLD